MRKIATILAALALAGCATVQNYQAILESFVGRSERELLMRWGPPDSVYESAGDRYLTYRRSETVYVPGAPPVLRTWRVGDATYTAPVGGTPGHFEEMSCKTTFILRGNAVAGWRHEGNNCVAMAP